MGEGRLAAEELEAGAPPGGPCSWRFRAVFDVKTGLVAPKGIIIREVALMLICRTVLNFGSVEPLSSLWSWRVFLPCPALQPHP